MSLSKSHACQSTERVTAKEDGANSKEIERDAVPFNIVGGFCSVTSRGHDRICTVHSPSETLCVISFLSLVTAALAII